MDRDTAGNAISATKPDTWDVLRLVLPPLLLSRLLFAAVLLLSAITQINSVPAREGLNFDFATKTIDESTVAKIKETLLSADGYWYIELAELGYHPGPFTSEVPRNWVFFPLFPKTIATLATLINKKLSIALILNFCCLLSSLILIYKFSLKLGYSKEVSQRAVWLLCFFPTSIFLSTPVSESLFLTLLLAAFYCISNRQTLPAGLLMLAASACRPTGLLLLPAFILALRESASLYNWKGIVSVCLAPIGGLLFIWHLHNLTGNALAFIGNQEQWGRHTEFTTGIEALVNEISNFPLAAWNPIILNLSYLMLALVVSVHYFKLKQFSFSLILLIPICAALSSGSLLCLGRYILPLFPLYFAMSAWCERGDTKQRERVLLSSLSFLYCAYIIGYCLHVTAAMA